jgi:hypothetical protein
MKITGPKIRMILPDVDQNRTCHMWPTEHGYLTLRGISMITGIQVETLRTRMVTYGERDPRVFSQEKLSTAAPTPRKRQPQCRKHIESIRVGSLEEKYLSRG